MKSIHIKSHQASRAMSLCPSDAFHTALFEHMVQKNTVSLDSTTTSTIPQMCLHVSKRGVNSECVGAMLGAAFMC